MQTKHSISHIAYWSLSALLVLAFLTAALPQSAQAAAPAAACSDTYTVKAGDTIGRIAKDNDVTINRLAKTNNLESPYNLKTGQELCIPDTSPSSPKGKFTATLSSDKVSLNGTDYKKTYTFFIKARENDSSLQYKLGRTQTDKKGVLKDSFKLPKELKNKSPLTICLKDSVTDALTCTRVFRQ